MSSDLSAEIWVGVWSPSYDEEEFDCLSDFCNYIGVDYCAQYDCQDEYFVGIEICRASDWGNTKLDFDKLKLLEEDAILKLKKIEELADEDFETQLVPCYF